MKRNFNKAQRLALWLAADGKCQICGVPIGQDFHADHIVPYSKGGETDIINAQALCPNCNYKKGAKYMQQNTTLRKWQQEEQEEFQNFGGKWFTLVATPGAGKTQAMLNNAYYMLKSGMANFLVIVVPSDTLKHQWKRKAQELFGISIKAKFDGWVSSDFQGVAVTYQQLAGKTGNEQVKALHRGRKVFVLFDEPHHMGEAKAWGDSARDALKDSVGGVLGTGTPFRSGNEPIPFVRYHPEKRTLVHDYLYPYSRGLTDYVVRALYFIKVDAEATWYSYTDDLVTKSFYDDVNERQMSERLNAVIEPDTDFVAAVIKQSYEELKRLRETEQANAKGLIICKDRMHAEGVAQTFRRITGIAPVVVTSDENHGDRSHIEAFNDSDDPFIIAVDMISEGVDIPPLRSLVYLTNKTAPLYFMQAIGRVVRVERGNELYNGYVYLPSDPRLLKMAQEIKEIREHTLKSMDLMQWVNLKDEPDEVVSPAPPKQLSLYQPLSATAIRDGGIYNAEEYSRQEIAEAEAMKKLHGIRAQVEVVAQMMRALKSEDTKADATPSNVAPVGFVADKEKELSNLRIVASKLANRLAFMRGIEVKEVHSEWVYSQNGKWQKEDSIKGIKEKVAWLQKAIEGMNTHVG